MSRAGDPAAEGRVRSWLRAWGDALAVRIDWLFLGGSTERLVALPLVHRVGTMSAGRVSSCSWGNDHSDPPRPGAVCACGWVAPDEGRVLSWQACPVCKGMGVVNRPPGVAADQQTFTSTSAGPWPCQTCHGETIILTPGGDDD